MKIPHLGPAGSYSEMALVEYNPEAERVALPSITAIFNAVAQNKCEVGFVPLQNRVEGHVADTLDNLLLHEGRISILDTSVLAIEHAIGIHPKSKKDAITRVLSKDTALAQCRQYLDESHPGIIREQRNSTSGAIQEVAQGKCLDAAAIGPKSTIIGSGLELVAENIGDIKNNRTRFALIGKGTGVFGPDTVTSLAIRPTMDRIGLLYEILGTISQKHGINLSSIQSRQGRTDDFPTFYLDLEGHISEDSIRACLRDLSSHDWIKTYNFGSYNFVPWEPRKIRTIGIIGGNGRMGQVFEKFFRANKYEVLISDKGTSLSNAELVSRSDAVLLSTPVYPVREVHELIDRVGAIIKPNQLLVDNFGVKADYVERMVQKTAPGVEVFSMHTMFGNVPSFAGHTIIGVKTEKSGQMASELIQTLIKNKVQMTYTDARTHDLSVLPVQGLNHVLAAAHTAATFNTVGHPRDLLPYLSLNARLPAVAFGRIMGGNPKMYAEMLVANPHAALMLKRLAQDIGDIAQAVERKDYAFVTSYFHRYQCELGGEHLNESKLAADYLLSALASPDSPTSYFRRQRPSDSARSGDKVVVAPPSQVDSTITFEKDEKR